MRVPPSGEKAQHITLCMCPVRVKRQDQSLVLHTRTVWSSDTVTRVPPSGEKAHDRTTRPALLVSVRRRDQSPVAHTHAVPSIHPVTRIRPLGAKQGAARYPAWFFVQALEGAH
eukprot:9342244-Pyramimonas_sp.AAC.2